MQFGCVAPPIFGGSAGPPYGAPQAPPQCSSWRLAARSFARLQVRAPCCSHHASETFIQLTYLPYLSPRPSSAGQPARPRPRQASGLSRPFDANGTSITGHAAAQQPSCRRWRHRRKAPALRAMAGPGPDLSGVPAARGALPGQIGALQAAELLWVSWRCSSWDV